MRRLFPLVLSGLMAASFGQLAAAQSVGAQGSAGASANVDVNKGGSTTVAPDVQNTQGKGYGKSRNKDKGHSDHEASTSGGASASGGASSSAGANAGSSKETGDTQARHDDNPADKASKH